MTEELVAIELSIKVDASNTALIADIAARLSNLATGFALEGVSTDLRFFSFIVENNEDK